MAETKDKNSDQKNYIRTDKSPIRPMAYPNFPKRQSNMDKTFPPPSMAGGEVAQPLDLPKNDETKKLIVGREIILNGEISTCDVLVVQGKVEASLKQCKTLEIDAGGEFRGTVTVDNAEINGLFDGQLTVNRKLHIRGNGRLNGKIRYQEIEIERGGVIAGTVEPMPENKESLSLLGSKEKTSQ